MEKWFQEAGMGLFIHFGLYSLLGGIYEDKKMDYIGEWIQSKYKIPNEEYSKLAKKFTVENFNADEYISLAKNAGCKYIVFTTKHHEGFCNFKTDYSDFNLWNYQKRDLVAELSEACKKYDVKLGLYYSQDLDWREKDAGGYNATLDNFGMDWGNTWDFGNCEHNFDNYLDNKVLPQIKELLTNYGEVSLLWFDCPMDMNEERTKKLYNFVKSIQPNCMINSRIGQKPGNYCDYFGLGDNAVAGKISNERVESPVTLNNTWGFKSFDHNWKKPETIIEILCGCASVNANLLVNIGPKGYGEWPDESIEIFKELEKWYKINGDSIYKNSPVNAPMNNENYKVTMRDNKVYIHFIKDTNSISLVHINNKLLKAKILGGEELDFSQNKENDLNIINIDFNKPNYLKVLELEFEGDLEFNNSIIEQNGNIVLNSYDAKMNILGSPDSEAQKIIGPAGEIYNTKMEIDPQGVIVNWYDTDNNISWDFILREAGEYKVSIITSAVYHSAKWIGGHKVYLENSYNKSPIYEIVDNGQVKEAGDIYKQYKTNIGTITLNEIGLNTLTLKANKIIKENSPGLSVVKLILEKSIKVN